MRSILILGMILLAGCATPPAVTGNYGVKPQTANESSAASLATTLTGGPTAVKKVCSVCGRQFDAAVKVCPYEGTELKDAK